MTLYVVYNKATTIIARSKNSDSFASKGAAKAKITRMIKDGKAVFGEYDVASYGYFKECIELHVERTNAQSGNKYMEAINTPNYMSASCDAYWD